MRSLTFYLMVGVVWGVIGCQRQPLKESSRLEVFIPESVNQSSWFKERLRKEELLLEIRVQTQGRVVWHQTLNHDLFHALEIPSRVFEEEVGEAPIQIEISVWEERAGASLNPILKGGREIQKEDLSESVSIYLSLQRSILEDLVDGL